ncbi:MAG: ABC transporter ATP-binding protein [Nitrospirota bacterium]
MYLLEIKDLKVYFYTLKGIVRAVDGVTLNIDRGEIVGVVGESGSGKSVTAMSIMRLIPEPPGKIAGGGLYFEGRDVIKLKEGEMQKIRGKKISMIFQEPMTALNPVFTVGEQIGEMLRLHLNMTRKDATDKSVELLNLVGISAPERRIKEYPHQLSGGMRQRIMIAMAVSCNPSLVIADEPTTALDVTIQAQIMDLILRLKEEFGMAIMFITHNFGVVTEICKRVVVMYAGKIVEESDIMTIFEEPRHPYTEGLLKAIPCMDDTGVKDSKSSLLPPLSKGGRRDFKTKRLYEIKGRVPDLYNIPEGCRFNPRCPYVMDICKREEPPLLDVGGGHHSACWLVTNNSEQITLKSR